MQIGEQPSLRPPTQHWRRTEPLTTLTTVPNGGNAIGTAPTLARSGEKECAW